MAKTEQERREPASDEEVALLAAIAEERAAKLHWQLARVEDDESSAFTAGLRLIQAQAELLRARASMLGMRAAIWFSVLRKPRVKTCWLHKKESSHLIGMLLCDACIDPFNEIDILAELYDEARRESGDGWEDVA